MQPGRQARAGKMGCTTLEAPRERSRVEVWGGGGETETKWVGNAGNTRGVLALFLYESLMA